MRLADSDLSPIECNKRCRSCGGTLTYKPGTVYLQCASCSGEQVIDHLPSEETIEESDYASVIFQLGQAGVRKEWHTVACTTCAAVVTMEQKIVADFCPYCGTNLIVENATSCSVLKPDYVLPFEIDRKRAQTAYVDWVESLWFAPRTLKRATRRNEKLQGIYVPFWTFDARVNASYQGQRGTVRYETIRFSHPNGKAIEQRVPRTSWSSASGRVSMLFDDILVPATMSLPHDIERILTNWNLQKLVKFRDEFLTGYRAESYTVGLGEGFDKATQRMQPRVDASIKDHIGGDDQRIGFKSVEYLDVRFKHILLPIWVSSFRHNNRIYRFVVNAQTGLVSGQRPYCISRIVLVVLLVVMALILLTMLFQRIMHLQ